MNATDDERPATRVGGWTPSRQEPPPAPAPEPEPEPPPEPALEPAPTRADERADEDADRLAPDELPWGVPTRAALPPDSVLPPAMVVSSRRPARVIAGYAAVGVILVLLVLALVVGLSR